MLFRFHPHLLGYPNRGNILRFNDRDEATEIRCLESIIAACLRSLGRKSSSPTVAPQPIADLIFFGTVDLLHANSALSNATAITLQDCCPLAISSVPRRTAPKLFVNSFLSRRSVNGEPHDFRIAAKPVDRWSVAFFKFSKNQSLGFANEGINRIIRLHRKYLEHGRMRALFPGAFVKVSILNALRARCLLHCRSSFCQPPLFMTSFHANSSGLSSKLQCLHTYELINK
jgi:hypothetical protein